MDPGPRFSSHSTQHRTNPALCSVNQADLKPHHHSMSRKKCLAKLAARHQVKAPALTAGNSSMPRAKRVASFSSAGPHNVQSLYPVEESSPRRGEGLNDVKLGCRRPQPALECRLPHGAKQVSKLHDLYPRSGSEIFDFPVSLLEYIDKKSWQTSGACQDQDGLSVIGIFTNRLRSRL